MIVVMDARNINFWRRKGKLFTLPDKKNFGTTTVLTSYHCNQTDMIENAQQYFVPGYDIDKHDEERNKAKVWMKWLYNNSKGSGLGEWLLQWKSETFSAGKILVKHGRERLTLDAPIWIHTGLIINWLEIDAFRHYPMHFNLQTVMPKL